MQTYQKKNTTTARRDAAAPPVPVSAVSPSPDALRAGLPSAGQLGQRLDLPGEIQAKMERAFGADFSGVRIYRSKAVAGAGAQAVAQGGRIAFAPDQTDFSSRKGQALLGHELSHVLSQARGEVTGRGFLDNAALEARADHEGELAARGEIVGPATGSLSSASAVSASGPMQAKKPEKQQGKTPASAPASSDLDPGNFNAQVGLQVPAPAPSTFSFDEEAQAPSAQGQGLVQGSQDAVDAVGFWGGEVAKDPNNKVAQAALQSAGERQMEELEQAAAGKSPGGGLPEGADEVLGNFSDGMDILNAVTGGDSNPLGMIQDAMEAYGHGKSAVAQWNQGSRSQAGAEALDALASGAGALSDFIPKGGFIAGGASAAAGLWKLAAGTYHRTKLGKRSRAAKKSDSADYNVVEQLHRATYRDQVDGGMQALQGGVQIGTEILDPTGVIAKLASKGVDMALDKGHEMAVSATQKKMRRDFLNREYDLDNKIADLQRQNPQMSEKDAKHEALRQLGANSGRRRELFTRGVASHAVNLKERADQNDNDAVGMLSDAGVGATSDGTYSMQAISEALGMERGVDWDEQIRDAATRPKRKK